MENLHKSIAQLVAAAMLANGEIDNAEMETAKKLADDIEAKWDDFKAVIEETKKQIDAFNSDDEFDKFVEDIAKSVTEEKDFVFEAITHVMLADNTFDIDELVVLSLIADALELNTEDIISTIAYIVKNKKDLEIKFA